MTKHLLDLHHVDELKNFATNNLLSWCLKSRTEIRAIGQSRTWEPCIEKGNYHYKTSLIGYWGKGLTVGW